MTHFKQTLRYQDTIKAFDCANSQDPNQEIEEEKSVPKELLYAQRMTKMLEDYTPKASEELFLAVRSQHLERWKLPRTNFPNDRKGYLKWRTQLKIYHANRAGELMQKNGYSGTQIQRVQNLLKKQKLKTDIEVQILEDVICLVFLNYYFAAFLLKHPEEKIISILQKTRQKMTDRSWQKALTFTYSDIELAILKKAFPKI